jgi:hypothetical protein
VGIFAEEIVTTDTLGRRTALDPPRSREGELGALVETSIPYCGYVADHRQ